MEALAQFLESLLGQSSKGSGTNYKFICPFDSCRGKDSNIRGDKKFEIDVRTATDSGKPINKWACWVCGNKGMSVYSLLKALKSPQHTFDQLSEIIKYTETKYSETDSKAVFSGSLPREYKPLTGKLPAKELKLRHAKVYLKKRGITENDIFKYSIGFCEDGEYGGRIIIPLHDKLGRVNYFVARATGEDVHPKYKYPQCNRDVVPNEMYINTEEPVVLCEGIFDAIAIKRNVIPLLGKVIQPEVMKMLISSKSNKVYLALDPDIMHQTIKYAEILMNEGKQVFTIDFSQYKPDEEDEDQKVDPGKMGFEAFTKLIQKATRLTASKLMKLKIKGL